MAFNPILVSVTYPNSSEILQTQNHKITWAEHVSFEPYTDVKPALNDPEVFGVAGPLSALPVLD